MVTILTSDTQELIHYNLTRELIFCTSIVRSREIIADARALLEKRAMTEARFASLLHLYENHELLYEIKQPASI